MTEQQEEEEQTTAALANDLEKFLRAFKDIRAGFASGNFVYGLMVAKVRTRD